VSKSFRRSVSGESSSCDKPDERPAQSQSVILNSFKRLPSSGTPSLPSID